MGTIDIARPRCPYCHTAVGPTDEKHGCGKCMAWHHATCWSEHGRCAACARSERRSAPAAKEPGKARVATYDPPEILQELPPPRSFWAVVYNPKIYRLEEALGELDVDLWTFVRGDVSPGDGVLLWQTLDSSRRRGIRAAGHVCSVAAECTVPAALRRYWTQVDDSPRRRVWLRYLPTVGFPLWIGEPGNDVVARLSVSRASGGGVYRVSETEWNEVMARAGTQAMAWTVRPEGRVLVVDHVLWIPHVGGDPDLKRRLQALEAGEQVELIVDGEVGRWTRMSNSPDGRPTLGLRPEGEAKRAWAQLLALRRGQAVDVTLAYS